MEKITRFEVIQDGERELTCYQGKTFYLDKIEYELQDSNQTLKVFLTNSKAFLEREFGTLTNFDKYLRINIDGSNLSKVIGSDNYKKEVLERLNYARTILAETNKKLEGTNFESLLNLIENSCQQLKGWIKEYKLELLENENK